MEPVKSAARWDAFALAARFGLALVWLYNGLWLKILARDEHHLRIVSSLFGNEVAGGYFLTAIGAGETVLALAILSGRACGFFNAAQIGAVLAMNLIAICFSGNIANPAGLLVSNLPLILCALALCLFGPGRFVFPPPKTR